MFISVSPGAGLDTFRVAVFPPVLGPVMMTLRSSGFTQMLMGTGGRLWGDSSDSLSLPSASESACSGMHPLVKPPCRTSHHLQTDNSRVFSNCEWGACTEEYQTELRRI